MDNTETINFVNSLTFKVCSDNLSKIDLDSSNCRVLNTINPNSYGISTKDTEFNTALKSSDYLVLDGVYFALASILLQGKNIKKNQGPEVFDHFINRLEITGGKAFFLGSTENTLKRIKFRIQNEYLNIRAGSYSPPFKTEFSENDNIEMIKSINSFQPDILLIGMTCPKQEKWAIMNRDRLNLGLVICIGNVFDWFAGTQKSIHPIWFKLRLAWLARVFLRPEVFKRNIRNQLIFFKDLLLIMLKIKKI